MVTICFMLNWNFGGWDEICYLGKNHLKHFFVYLLLNNTNIFALCFQHTTVLEKFSRYKYVFPLGNINISILFCLCLIWDSCKLFLIFYESLKSFDKSEKQLFPPLSRICLSVWYMSVSHLILKWVYNQRGSQFDYQFSTGFNPI